MSDDVRPQPFPQLRFDNANNASLSLRVLGEEARTGRVKVFERGLDGTGKLLLAIELPGSGTVRRQEHRR